MKYGPILKMLLGICLMLIIKTQTSRNLQLKNSHLECDFRLKINLLDLVVWNFYERVGYPEYFLK